ncbi:zinc finger protein 436-like, partial [Narcine bancroftii]|uniref:zinc finger protein 436-like n=1 Tax=Narcine bancroftii TaxID=1343680 RepID=UPI0038311E62
MQGKQGVNGGWSVPACPGREKVPRPAEVCGRAPARRCQRAPWEETDVRGAGGTCQEFQGLRAAARRLVPGRGLQSVRLLPGNRTVHRARCRERPRMHQLEMETGSGERPPRVKQEQAPQDPPDPPEGAVYPLQEPGEAEVDEEKAAVCGECGGAFGSRRELESHTRRSHGPGAPAQPLLFQCAACREVFAGPEALLGHGCGLPGRPEAARRCPLCHRSFAQLAGLLAHSCPRAPHGTYPCTACGKAFAQASQLQHHQRAQCGEKPFRCDVCGRCFSQASKLLTHQSIHSGQKPFPCEACGRSYNRLDNLRRHQRAHLVERPHRCPDCGRAFAEAERLQAHRRAHAPRRPHHRCADCGRSFVRPAKLAQHRCGKAGEKAHRCADCGRAYSRAENLRRHQRSHGRPRRPLSCLLCRKSFNLFSTFLAHQAAHTGDKPFRCPVCSKGFGVPASLRAHQSIHTGNKPYQCQACPRAYNRLDNLRRHQRGHQGAGAQVVRPGRRRGRQGEEGGGPVAGA